jgi:hypothetical protein
MSDPNIPTATQGDTSGEAAAVPPVVRPSALSEADSAALDEYVQEMTQTVIPEIVRVVEERRKLASLSRQWPLKIGG